MAQTQPQQTAPEGTYGKCPLCNGVGWAVKPLARQSDSSCRLCRGTGVVAEKCVCGRPAFMDRAGYLGNGRYYCGNTDCRKIIEELIGAKDPNKKKATGFQSWWERDWDQEDYERWAQMGCG